MAGVLVATVSDSLFPPSTGYVLNIQAPMHLSSECVGDALSADSCELYKG